MIVGPAQASHRGMPGGMYVTSHEAAEPWIEKGRRFFHTPDEITFIKSGNVAFLKEFGRNPPSRSTASHTSC